MEWKEPECSEGDRERERKGGECLREMAKSGREKLNEEMHSEGKVCW